MSQTVHHPLKGGAGWVVTEPITGRLAVNHAMVSRRAAIEETKARCLLPGAKEHVRKMIAEVLRDRK